MAAPSSFEIRTSSRIHFGLWGWGHARRKQFGGVGMMVDRPTLAVRFTPHVECSVVGLHSQRVQQVVQQCRQAWGWSRLPAYRIELTESPMEHAGFGLGTQLSLAVTRGLAVCSGMSPMVVEQQAKVAGRGLRSSVGTFGFAHGGLIVDAGKHEGETVGELEDRIPVPDAWRMLLVTPRELRGKAGAEEQVAFAKVPPVPEKMTCRLQSIARDRLMPACREADFDRFSAAIYEYGYLAGLCFAAVQGGPYSSPQVRHMVATLRKLGAAGVGQSSWGPTVFGLMPDQAAAERLESKLREIMHNEAVTTTIAGPKNSGAELVQLDRGQDAPIND